LADPGALRPLGLEALISRRVGAQVSQATDRG
jgi:hypothetical protein